MTIRRETFFADFARTAPGLRSGITFATFPFDPFEDARVLFFVVFFVVGIGLTSGGARTQDAHQTAVRSRLVGPDLCVVWSRKEGPTP